MNFSFLILLHKIVTVIKMSPTENHMGSLAGHKTVNYESREDHLVVYNLLSVYICESLFFLPCFPWMEKNIIPNLIIGGSAVTWLIVPLRSLKRIFISGVSPICRRSFRPSGTFNKFGFESCVFFLCIENKFGLKLL